jgi:hypothetical protein
MVQLGIGVKVATLPVVALGVGIGVDYALYLLSVQLGQQRLGLTLAQSYQRAVAFTGKVVALVGVTLAAGGITWAFSPIKFQADMESSSFMFPGTCSVRDPDPALSHFLLRARLGCTRMPCAPGRARASPGVCHDAVSSMQRPGARGRVAATGDVAMTLNGGTRMTTSRRQRGHAAGSPLLGGSLP